MKLMCFNVLDITRGLMGIVAKAFVCSRQDYCRYLFCSLSYKNITRLQNIQNCFENFVFGASRFIHGTPTLKSLDWLPVKQ